MTALERLRAENERLRAELAKSQADRQRFLAVILENAWCFMPGEIREAWCAQCADVVMCDERGCIPCRGDAK